MICIRKKSETKEYPNTLENNQFTIFQVCVYKGKLDKLLGYIQSSTLENSHLLHVIPITDLPNFCIKTKQNNLHKYILMI